MRNREEVIITNMLPTKEDLKNFDLFMYEITQEEVESKDHTRLDKLFKILESAGTDARSKMSFTFGYNEDPREVYNIPEIREFVKTVYDKHRELFYYLSLDVFGILQTWLLCMLKVRILKVIGDKQHLDVERDIVLAQRIFDDLKFYTEKINDYDMDEIEKIIKEVLKSMGLR